MQNRILLNETGQKAHFKTPKFYRKEAEQKTEELDPTKLDFSSSCEAQPSEKAVEMTFGVIKLEESEFCHSSEAPSVSLEPEFSSMSYLKYILQEEVENLN